MIWVCELWNFSVDFLFFVLEDKVSSCNELCIEQLWPRTCDNPPPNLPSAPLHWTVLCLFCFYFLENLKQL